MCFRVKYLKPVNNNLGSSKRGKEEKKFEKKLDTKSQEPGKKIK
jgi:hypothetical protein